MEKYLTTLAQQKQYTEALYVKYSMSEYLRPHQM